ncbi:MAG TPA: hypothetical protein VF786_04170 [Terriglobales bacterium]
MRTRFVVYVLVLAGLALTQVSLNKTSAPTGKQIQVAGSGPGSVMTPPSCKDPDCGLGGGGGKTQVVVSVR